MVNLPVVAGNGEQQGLAKGGIEGALCVVQFHGGPSWVAGPIRWPAEVFRGKDRRPRQ